MKVSLLKILRVSVGSSYLEMFMFDSENKQLSTSKSTSYNWTITFRGYFSGNIWFVAIGPNVLLTCDTLLTACELAAYSSRVGTAAYKRPSIGA